MNANILNTVKQFNFQKKKKYSKGKQTNDCKKRTELSKSSTLVNFPLTVTFSYRSILERFQCQFDSIIYALNTRFANSKFKQNAVPFTTLLLWPKVCRKSTVFLLWSLNCVRQRFSDSECPSNQQICVKLIEIARNGLQMRSRMQCKLF